MPTNADTSDRGYLLTQLDNKRVWSNYKILQQILCKSTKYNKNLMLTNITNTKKHVILKRLLINMVCACASYIGHSFQEKQLLEVC